MKEMSVGSHMLNYQSLVVLTHFKGHVMGGFGGSNKNIGIGCADGHVGKKWIHSREEGEQWSVAQEELMERIETRHGLRQLSCMHEMGMGNTRYHLLDIDHGDREISQQEAVAGVVPFQA